MVKVGPAARERLPILSLKKKVILPGGVARIDLTQDPRG